MPIKTRRPLWTVCNGENEGYGSSAPATSGQIVLDLKNMKKIIEVDQELGFCMVEPGVTYSELDQYLKKNKINLWLDVPAPSADVSIVGNILERGCGYTPYSEDFLFSCGMEVVLADGTLLKTGMGGIPIPPVGRSSSGDSDPMLTDFFPRATTVSSPRLAYG